MTALRLFHSLEPYFCAGLLDDPLLLVRIRPTGRSLLFDCGQLHHLAKRILRSIDTVFITHAHMDHFMGLDHLIRHTHVSPHTLDIYGPPGIALRVAHKLAGYDWNLAEDWWRTVLVHEIHDDRIEHHRYAGAKGFTDDALGAEPRYGTTIYITPFVTVDAQLFDHGIPVLAFRLTEQEVFAVDPGMLAAEGLHPGTWLGELKNRWRHGTLGDGPLQVLRMTAEGPVETECDNAFWLYQRIRRAHPAASLGYLTDIGFTPPNRQRLRELLEEVSLLCCECTFHAADRHKARSSHHLCTDDVSQLAAELRPKALLPMHLSKTYLRQPFALYRELNLPEATRLLQLPEYLTPRPCLLTELPPTANRQLLTEPATCKEVADD